MLGAALRDRRRSPCGGSLISEERDVVRNHSVNRIDCAPDWLRAELAVQQRLGLWPERTIECGAARGSDPGADGQDLA